MPKGYAELSTRSKEQKAYFRGSHGYNKSEIIVSTNNLIKLCNVNKIALPGPVKEYLYAYT